MSPREIETLKEELKELKEEIQKQEQDNNVLMQKFVTEDKGSGMDKSLRSVQVLVGLVVFVIGMGVAWGIATTKIEGIATNKQEIAEVEKRTRQLEMHDVVNAELLKHISRDITVIKEDIKTLLGGKNKKDASK